MAKFREILLSGLLTLLFPLFLYSQTGPMGIGNKDGTPTPAGPQPKLLLWLDGSSVRGNDPNTGEPTMYQNNMAVDIWLDKSGNENHFFPTGTYRPFLKTSGTSSGPTGPNGAATPCVTFGSLDYQMVCSNFELPEDGYTIYFVIKTSDDNFGLFSYATPTSNGEMLIYNDNGIEQQMKDTLNRVSDIGDISTGAWNYGGITWSNIDGNNWEYTKGSENEIGYNTFNGISISSNGTAMIGDIQNAEGVYPSPDAFEGSIAEIFIYAGRLPRPATRLLRTYLWVKYGFSESVGGWDKFHGDMTSITGKTWGGKYYAPIGIGNDIANPNAGSINEARSAGLVLRVNDDDWTQDRSYLCAAPVGNSVTGLAVNEVVTSDLGSTTSVLKRWSRLWEISGISQGNDQYYQIAFDFKEGIEGVGDVVPQNPENFVLLYRNSATTGNFSILPVPVNDKYVFVDELVFRIKKSDLLTINRYYTIGTTDLSSSLTGEVKRTWYAYKTGNWSDPLSWTLDGSAAPTYVNPDGLIPAVFDNIYIGAGRKITVDMTLPAYDNIKVFGTLDLASQPQPNFVTIAGSGTIRCAAGNFPLGNSTAFADPIIGGTLEFYGPGGFTQATNLVVNRLKINLATSAATMRLAANLTTNGLFEVNKGTFIVNNTANISRTLISNENVLVENTGKILVSNAPPLTTHKWYFYKDLINNGGEVKFTNRSLPAVPDQNSPAAYAYYTTAETNDIITAYFSSSSNNQELQANGPSYFSRIVIDKGTDMTYILSISSNHANYFKLLGRCNHGMAVESYLDEFENPNALALINGTVEIRERIFVPLTVNVSQALGSWNINETAQLWINGGEATKGPLGGTKNTAALVIYGLVKVSAGVLNVWCNSGITIRDIGVLQVDGGTVNATQIRTSLLGLGNTGGLIMNGGEININTKEPVQSLAGYYAVSLTYPGNLFRMTGGTLNITKPTSAGLIFINSDPQNTSVTGGTVHLDISDNQDSHNITTRAAFWNLTLTRSYTSSTVKNFKVIEGNSGPDAVNTAYIGFEDLIIQNNLSITGPNKPTLQMGDLSNPVDLFLYGDLTINSNCFYLHNNNTTRFVGSTNSNLTLGGSISIPFYNVEINKEANSRFVNINPSGPSLAMDIFGSLNIEKGYFINNNRNVDVKGNVTNRSQFGDEGSTGFLRLNGSGRQEIISNNGIFHKLIIDNSDGVAVKNDGITVKTWLQLQSGSLFLGDNKLRLETIDPSPIQSYNTTDKFIVCGGNASAGGVEILNHTPNQTLTFPIGVNAGENFKYTSAEIVVNSGWSDNGFIRVTPVDTLLSTSDISGGSDYLNYYWKVSSTEYNIKPNVSHRFLYNNSDVRGTTEANLESGRVLSGLPFTRSYDNAPVSAHVDTLNNFIYYNGGDAAQSITVGNGTPLVDADYSAGAADRFIIGSSPEIYFSRSATVGAVWQIPGNWNTCIGCTDPYDYHSTGSGPATVATDYPKAGDVAVIGFNVNHTAHKPHVYKAPPGGILAAQVVFTPLQDNSGNRQPRYYGSTAADLGILRPTLQVTATEDIIRVSQISGEGELMLKGDVDLGVTDIGNFLAEDSSIVVINNGVLNPSLSLNFLPPVVPNLFLARTAAIITSDIQVRGNLEIAGNSSLFLSETKRGNIEIDGDLILDKYQVSSGARPSVFFNKRGTLKTINVHGDLKLLGTNAYIGINSVNGPVVEPQPWTPEEVGAQMQIWLDANDTSTIITNSSNVTSWQNKASSGPGSASQTTTANQPTFPGNGLNGLATIRFDGINDFLQIPHSEELNILANQNFEIFSVVKLASSGDFHSIYAKGDGSENHGIVYYIGQDEWRFFVDHVNALYIRSPNKVYTQANLGWARRQGNFAETFNSIAGNASKSNVAYASTAGDLHNVTIGASLNGTARLLHGDVGEIIVIRRALTSDERRQMEGYLAHKWGLEGDLPEGHPYKNEIPFIGGNDNGTPSQLIVSGDIIQDLTGLSPTNNGIELYKIGTDTAFANLILQNSGTNEFINLHGPTPRLWKLKLDKGNNTTSSFAFNTDVEIDGPADEPEKPVHIQNGKLIFNNNNIDVTLASGGDNFMIPVSGGIELQQGQLNIIGGETGLILSGVLKITGGLFKLGSTEGDNNYIEYAAGATSAPKISITGGTLLVGSQLRRTLESTGGALDYRQSGGEVILGRYSAPATNRGVLEILNPGSRFEHTGGTLTFVRGITLGSMPSILLQPSTYDVSETSEIIIGNINSPSGAAVQNFGIQSEIPVNSLTINSVNSPIVRLITNDLELNGDLIIQAGATLNCDDRNLLLHQNVLNNGTLGSTNGLIKLIHPGSALISGAGIFDLYDLTRSGGSGGQTQVQTDLLVKNNFINDEGEMDFQGNTLTVIGNVTTDGTLHFDAASNGLVLNGTEPQILTRTGSGTSEIDVMTINNNFGVTIPAQFHSEFTINKNLRLEKGIFSLTGNLLEMAEGSVFTPVNPFSETNMIVTGGTFANYGILMHIPANSHDDIFIPLGLDRYMPVNLDFSKAGYSSGTSASTYLLRIGTGENGVVIEDVEADSDPPTAPEIDDLNNVLGIYFSVDGSNIGAGLNMDLKFRYDDQYVQVTNPYTEADYTAARVLADNTTISKLGPEGVDEVNNILTFHLQGDFTGNQYAVDGDYFAGIDAAIPNTILVYKTDPGGSVDNGDTTYDIPVPGGGAPAGALVIVQQNDVLIFDVDGINFYRTVIEEGATVVIDRTSQHRLGKVTGTGTIILNGTGYLPAGDYTEFFGCEGGKLMFQANITEDLEVLSNMPPIKEVTLFGPGNITVSNSAVNVCNNLFIKGQAKVKAANFSLLTVGGDLKVESGEFDFRQGTALIQGDLVISGTTATGGLIKSGNNGKVTIEGDMVIGGKGMSLGTVFRETHLKGNLSKTTSPSLGSIQEGTGGAKLVFDGTNPQSITGDFTGISKIPSIELSNDSGLTLLGDIDVSEKLQLTEGNVFTSQANILRFTEDFTVVEPEGGQQNSFVDGPMQWILTGTAAKKIFPVGNNEWFRPLSISNRTAARTWEVQYTDDIASTVSEADIVMIPNPTSSPAIETVSLQEYWRVSTNSGSTFANIGLSWGDSSVVSTNPSDQSKLVVLAYDETTDVWDSYGGQDFHYDAPTNTGNFMSTSPVLFSQRYITLGSTDGINPLPVTWLYFTGENKGKDNILKWATASERNNDYFELERSFDAENWTFLAQITAAGESSTKMTYTYTDPNIPFGIVYYRLKQIDFDGAWDFFPHILSLESKFQQESNLFDFVLYPNPTKIESVRFRMSNTFDVQAHVSISDLSGQLLSESYVHVDGSGTSAPVHCNLQPGIYLVSVVINNKMRSKPLVIMK